MKISFISTMAGQPWGGSEYLWSSAAHEALKAGHEAQCVVYEHAAEVPQLQRMEEQGANIVYRPLPVTLGLLKRISNKMVSILGIQFRSHWVRDLDGFDADVVCISQGNTYEVLQNKEFLDWAMKTKTPRIHICQLNSMFHIPSSIDRELARALYRSAARVLFVADENRVAAERQLACDLHNASVIRNPVNLNDINAIPAWHSGSKLHMAVVARLEVRYKGHDLLLDALSSDVWRERNWQLGFYGEGQDREYILDLVKHYRLEDKVRLCGYIADVQEIWTHNQLLVLPSRAEGTPLALVEAMLSGRPVLATDVGGNREWIRDSDTGFIADGVSARSIRDTLERLWLRRHELPMMGKKARELALTLIDQTPGSTLLDILKDAANK